MGKPVFDTENNLTYTEVHAAILGVAIGVLIGYGHGLGYTTVALVGSVAFVGIAFGIYRRGSLPKAQRTIQREPWYALSAFVVGASVGTVL